MQQVRSLGPLASFTTVLLCVMAIIGALGVAVALRRAGMFEQFLDAKFDGSYADLEDKFDDSDVQLGGVWLAFLVAWLVTVVAFISWQYRHARNAEALGGDGLGAGWAVGGWFIPVANLVLPGVQLFGASKAATRRARDRAERPARRCLLGRPAARLAGATAHRVEPGACPARTVGTRAQPDRWCRTGARAGPRTPATAGRTATRWAGAAGARAPARSPAAGSARAVRRLSNGRQASGRSGQAISTTRPA